MMSRELNARNLREEIENYSAEHCNDFGIPDGKDRIPMKKLMKLFEIKKKTAPEKQNLFRQLVNELCDLEIKEEIGKVLVLKENFTEEESSSYGDSDDDDLGNDEPDYGYGEAGNDKIAELNTKADSDGEADLTKQRTRRFKPPTASASGGLSVCTAESVGLYDGDQGIRRTGYRRRGSVTRYSIIGHEQVANEYRKHEDVINQFRRDSLKIEHSIRNLSLSNGSNHSNSKSNSDANSITKAQEASFGSPKRTLTPAEQKKKGIRLRMMGSGKGRSRFSLAF